MALIRIELDADRERARRFSERVARGEPFPAERQLVIEEAWARGYTPTGRVTFRGLGQGQPPTLKFDVEVDVSL